VPGSVTSAFTEPEDFEAALRAEGCRGLLIIGHGRFRARLTQIALNVLRLSATEEELSRIAFLAVPNDVILLMIPTDDLPLPICGGISARAGEIVTLCPGEQAYSLTNGRSHASTIWVPIKELVRYGGSLTGAPFAIPPVVKCWRPTPGALRNLRSLHLAATRMATRRPQTLIDAVTAHGLEQQLIHAIVECLRGSEGTPSQSGRRHQDLMVRFERSLNSQPGREMRVEEICATLDVSERLLRILCAEHLGMGPISYDRLRRMSLVRHALRRVNGEATVSAVARRYGFRSPGRFAVNYRAAFGETPSTTLRRGGDSSIVRLLSTQMKVL
jgi:AraC-like DNA-binding protein